MVIAMVIAMVTAMVITTRIRATISGHGTGAGLVKLSFVLVGVACFIAVGVAGIA